MFSPLILIFFTIYAHRVWRDAIAAGREFLLILILSFSHTPCGSLFAAVRIRTNCAFRAMGTTLEIVGHRRSAVTPHV